MFSDSSFRASTSMAGYRLCKSPGRHYNSEHICHIVQVPSQLSQATITSVPPASNGENYAFERSLTRSHHLSLCSGSISLPSYGHHVTQTFQLLHQLPLRNSLKHGARRRAIPDPVLSHVPPSTEMTLTLLSTYRPSGCSRWPNFAVLHPTHT